MKLVCGPFELEIEVRLAENEPRIFVTWPPVSTIVGTADCVGKAVDDWKSQMKEQISNVCRP